MKHLHKLFCMHFIKNGNNATQAYLSTYNNSSNETAKANGYKLLNNTHIKHYLEEQNNKQLDLISSESIACKKYLINEAHEIGVKAAAADDFNPALKAVELKGKLNQVFAEEKESGNYATFINSLVINNNASTFEVRESNSSRNSRGECEEEL